MVEIADILPSVQSDQSTLKLKFCPIDERSRGPSSWKFNNSLTTDKCFVDSMKSNIPTFYEKSKELKDPVTRWEFLKYKIRQFTINYSKEKASERKAGQISLEKAVKRLEISLSTNSNETLLEEYYKHKNELNLFTISLLIELFCAQKLVGMNMANSPPNIFQILRNEIKSSLTYENS